MLYFRCKYYDKCGGEACSKCPERKALITEELKEAVKGNVEVLLSGPTDNEIYVATLKAEKKYGRRRHEGS